MKEEKEEEVGVVNIRGKKYLMVKMRMQSFREHHSLAEGWGIRTERLEAPNKMVAYKAEIVSPAGLVVATGHKTISVGSFTGGASEKCETQAVGRALSFAGYGGADMEIASADDMLEAFWSDDERHCFFVELGAQGVSYENYKKFVEKRQLEAKGLMPWQIDMARRTKMISAIWDEFHSTQLVQEQYP